MTRKLVLLLHKLDGSRPVTAGYNLMIMTQAASGKSIYGGDENPAEKSMPQINSSLMFNMIAAGVGSNMNDSANSEEADRIVLPALELVDIAGYNYASGRYPLEGKCHPERVIFGSETFPQDIAKNWKMVEEYPYLIGDFMWTAWDYLGEAGGGAWGYIRKIPLVSKSRIRGFWRTWGQWISLESLTGNYSGHRRYGIC